jgi:hypothetical protein
VPKKRNPLQNKHAALCSWANTKNRTARTEPGRQAMRDKFLREADGDVKRAEAARKAFYLNMAIKSAKIRQAKKKERETREAAGDAA